MNKFSADLKMLNRMIQDMHKLMPKKDAIECMRMLTALLETLPVKK